LLPFIRIWEVGSGDATSVARGLNGAVVAVVKRPLRKEPDLVLKALSRRCGEDSKVQG
jgi:hypothetical protein